MAKIGPNQPKMSQNGQKSSVRRRKMGQKQPKMTPKWPKTVGKTAKKWPKTAKNDPKWPEMMGKMAKMKPKTAKNSGFVLSWQSCPPTAGVSPRGDVFRLLCVSAALSH